MNHRNWLPIRSPWKKFLSLAGLCFCIAACSADPKIKSEKFLASGDRYMSEGKTAAGIIEYRNAVQLDPSSGIAHLKLADAYLRADEGVNALRELVRAADLLPDDAGVQIRAGELLLLDGRFDDARARAEKILARDARNPAAHILLANALAGLQDFNAAVAMMEEALTLNLERREAAYANLGVLELGRGRADEAERAFKKAIELNPRSPAGYMALANFYWVTGRLVETAQALQQALSLDPNSVSANRAMAAFVLATNRTDEAEPYLKKVFELTKSNVAAFILADYYISRDSDLAALALLEPLLTDAQASNSASVRLATIDHRQGRSQRAYQRLEAILAKEKTHLQALLAKGRFLIADGKLNEAYPVATAVAAAHKGSAQAAFLLGWVHAERGELDDAVRLFEEVMRLNPRATAVKVALAELHLAKGQAGASLRMAQEALDGEPGNVDAQFLLVDGLLARRELTRAESELGKLSTAHPASARVQVQLGTLRGIQRRTVEARAHFERAIALDPKSLDALDALVALDVAGGRPNEARRRVEERLGSGAAEPPLLLLAARTYAAVGDEAAAENLLKRALKQDPSYLPGFRALGDLYMKQGRLGAARAELEALAAREERPVAALTMVGTILEAEGDIKGARARYQSALDIDPNAVVAANNLAWILATHGGNLDVALRLAQTAKRGLPDSPQVNDTLGFIYYKKDLPTLAIPAYKEVLTKDGTNPVYHSRLGLAYAKAGNKEDARRHLTHAFRLRGDFNGAQEARRVLESLK